MRDNAEIFRDSDCSEVIERIKTAGNCYDNIENYLVTLLKILDPHNKGFISADEIKEGLNFFRKESVIKNLYQSKIINEKDDSHITEDSFELEKIESEEYTGLKLVEENSENNKLRRTDTQGKDITYSSYLYKISTDRKIVKKLYFRLFNKDLYYFKSSTSKTYKGMHNLSHYFLELDPEFIENLKPLEKRNTESNSESYEEDESYIDSASSITNENKSNSDKSDKDKPIEIKPIKKIIDSKEYFCFVLVNQNGKAQWYLTPDKDIYDEWAEKLKHIKECIIYHIIF